MDKITDRIIFDYLAFTTKIDSIDSIVKFLGLDNLNFTTSKGFHGYRQRLYFDGIHIHFDGQPNMGICVEMSGQGCRNFETFGTGDFMEVFSYIFSNPDNLHITRLDVAYDDFDGFLNFDELLDDVRNYNWVSRFRELPVEQNFSKDETKRGVTIYCGSKKSEVMFRIYDKKAEQKRLDLNHWTRFEMQLRRDRSLTFIEMLLAGNDLNTLFVSVVNNYIRFIEPTDTDSNLWRAPMAGYWAKFITTLSKTSLYRPGTDYNISNLENFVVKQCSSAIVSFIALFGFGEFRELVEGKSRYKLNDRHRQVLLSHGISNIEHLFKGDWWNEPVKS